MSPSSSRRALLRSSVPLVGTALAGCSSLGLGREKLTLTLLNFTPELHRLSLQLLRTDRGEREDAVVHNREYELAGDTPGEVGRVRDPNVVPSRRYLVRAELGDPQRRAHHHFYPSCAGEDRLPEELYVEIHQRREDDPNDGPYLEFQQNVCGGSSGLL